MSTELAAPRTVSKPTGLFRTAFQMWRSRIGMLLVLLIGGIALFGPWFAPFAASSPVGQGALKGKAWVRHVPGTLFGSGYLGKDVWSTFLLGGRELLVMAVVATAIALVLGSIVGLLAGYSKGLIDTALMRTMDLLIAFPSLLLVLVVFTTFDVSNTLIVLVVALTTVPRIARVVRGSVTPVVERDFVGAAEAIGESRWFILRKELLPNVAAPLLVEANLRIAYSIGLIGALGFLGIVANSSQPNWGLMINQNRDNMATQPWAVVLPVVAIAILTVGAGLVADGLSRATAGIDRARADA
jgi:peptide/nickel transport system permease protein